MSKESKMPYKILITAGPTIEPIDPVRYISNRSTGIMGYTIAEEAAKRGNSVYLVSGPVNLPVPECKEVIKVETAEQMMEEIKKRENNIDCIIMAAAVCDFKPLTMTAKKIKKKELFSLNLTENKDLLKNVATRKGLLKVGFALETENLWKNAQIKIKEKELDLIVANQINASNNPFGEGKTSIMIIDREGKKTKFENITKKECASIILDEIEKKKT